MLHNKFLFEIKELKKNDNEQLYNKCRDLGIFIYDNMIESGGSVRPRSHFSAVSAIARINFILVECFAFLSEAHCVHIVKEFTDIFPRLSSGQCIITTGHIRAIFLGLTTNIVPQNRSNNKIKAHIDLQGQSKTALQKTYKMEYAQSAIILIELLYEQRVQIEFINKQVGYGLRSNFNSNKIFSQTEPLLTGINLPTEAGITKLVVSDVNTKGQESFVDVGTGVFGLPFYLNSSRVNGLVVDSVVPTCTLEVTQALVSVFDSESSDFSDSFQVQLSVVKVAKNITLRKEDKMTWNYEYSVN
jgi:hypothetical protein